MAKCPTCNATVPDRANYCGACGAELRGGGLEGRAGVQTWSRGTADVAMRIDIEDIEGLLRKGLVVEQGTSAVLIKDGSVVERLEAGRYDLAPGDTRLRRVMERIVQALMPSKSCSVLLVDTSDTPLQPIGIENVLTAEGVPVGVRIETTVRVVDPVAMMTNLLKGQRSLTTEELSRNVLRELANVVKSKVRDEKLENLYANLELRGKIEDAIATEMRRTLTRLGVELVQVRIVQFTGEIVTELARRRGRMYLDLSRTEIFVEFSQRIGDLKNEKLRHDYQQKLEEVDTQAKLDDLIRDFYRDKAVKDALSTAEIDAVQDEIRMKELLRKLEQQRVYQVQTAETEEAVEDVRHGARIRREVQATQAKAEQLEVLRQQSRKARQDNLDDLERKRAIDRQHERELLEMRNSASGQALLSVITDPDARDRIERLERMRVAEGLSEEQLMALAAPERPEVARALLEKYRALGDDGRFRELQGIMEKANQDVRDAATEAMQQMGQVAQRQADNRDQVIMAGGMGVYMPGSGGQRKSCPHCGGTHDAASKFCPDTGKKLP